MCNNENILFLSAKTFKISCRRMNHSRVLWIFMLFLEYPGFVSCDNHDAEIRIISSSKLKLCWSDKAITTPATYDLTLHKLNKPTRSYAESFDISKTARCKTLLLFGAGDYVLAIASALTSNVITQMAFTLRKTNCVMRPCSMGECWVTYETGPNQCTCITTDSNSQNQCIPIYGINGTNKANENSVPSSDLTLASIQCTGKSCDFLSDQPSIENDYCQCDGKHGLEYKNCMATCEMIDYCLNGGSIEFHLGAKSCVCDYGFSGSRCQTFHPCITGPCNNGAVCVDVAHNEYLCRCAVGYHGVTCEIFDPCSSSPCKHNGMCRNVTESTFTCTCFYGYHGPLCEHVDPCHSSPCANGGICKNHSDTQYSCSCKDGFHGHSCELYKPCIYDPCLHGGVCNSEDGNFFCQCPHAYYGRRCESLNMCLYLEPCGPHSVACHNISDSDYTCVCEVGWSGKTCRTYSPCFLQPCRNGAECIENPDMTYDCKCGSMHFGDNCEHTNLCKADPCKNHAQCKNTSDVAYECKCLPGYYGFNCEHINPCFLSVCMHGASCKNTSATTYDCVCAQGYFGDKCQFHDACMSSPCQRGQCKSYRNGSYSCHCEEGYSGDYCRFYKACSSDPCQGSGTCVDADDGSYVCKCAPGNHGYNCEFHASCLKNPCLYGGKCLDLPGGDFKCSCPPGKFGRICKSTNPCADNPCVNGNCNATDYGLYECNCNEGYYGHACENFDPCASEPCESGDCVRLSTKENKFKCKCKPGYRGVLCDELVPCNEPGIHCKNNGTCMENREGVFKCECPPGYQGMQCEERPMCLLEGQCQHGGHCDISVTGESICQCLDGFNGERCEAFDTCTELSCNNNGICVRIGADEKCHCPSGYEGEMCEKVVNACHSNPCSEYYNCVDLPERYICTCPVGFKGRSCKDKVMCNTETIHESRGTYTWNQVPHGINISIECARTPRKYATRRCFLSDNGTAVWGTPDTSSCSLTVSNHIQALEALNPFKDPSVFNSSSIMREALELLNNVLPLATSSRIHSDSAATVTPRNSIRQVHAAPNVAGAMMDVIHSLLSAPHSLIVDSGIAYSTQMRRHPQEKCKQCGLLEILDEFMGTLDWIYPNVTFRRPSFELYMKEVAWIEHENGLKFKPMSHPGIEIYLPPEVFQRDPSSERVKFIYFKNSNMFNTAEGKTMPGVVNEVLSAAIGTTEMRNLKQCVTFRLPNMNYPRSASCVYWDDWRRYWSKDGLHKMSYTGSTTTCCSTHLTSFALASDPGGTGLSLSEEKFLLNLTGWNGMIAGVISCVVVCVTYICSRNLNIQNMGKIVIMLSISLTIKYPSMVISRDRHTIPGSQLCVTMGALSHLSVLTALTWTLLLVHCVCVSMSGVKLFEESPKKRRLHTLKRCLFGFGFPLLCVGLTCGLYKQSYLADLDLCRLTPSTKKEYYSTFFGPSCVCLSMTCIISVAIVIKLCKQMNFGFGKRNTLDESSPMNGLNKNRFDTYEPSGAVVCGTLLIATCELISWISDLIFIANKSAGFSIYFACSHYVINGVEGMIILMLFLILRKDQNTCFKCDRSRSVNDQHLSIAVNSRDDRYSLVSFGGNIPETSTLEYGTAPISHKSVCRHHQSPSTCAKSGANSAYSNNDLQHHMFSPKRVKKSGEEYHPLELGQMQNTMSTKV